MRQRKYTLTPAHVQTHTTYCLQKHLRLADHGPKCTPIPSGPSSATPAAVSSPWPPPVPLSATLPPTPPPTMPSWQHCLPSPNCNNDSTVPCRATYPKPCAAADNRWPSTSLSSPTTANPTRNTTKSTAVRPRAAPATSMPTPPPTSSAKANVSPWL